MKEKFSKEKCTFKDESLRYLAAFTSQACGASDEDIVMAVAGMMKCLFDEGGLEDISPLGKSLMLSQSQVLYGNRVEASCRFFGY